jgi:hypothetical protein
MKIVRGGGVTQSRGFGRADLDAMKRGSRKCTN